MNNTVIILRATPGSGKTSFAKLLETICDMSEITFCNCCADEWFEDMQGNYNFIQEELGQAHMWCKNMYKSALHSLTQVIVVSNTNTKEHDVNVYRNLALEHNYKVVVLTVENWHQGQDLHNVPSEVKDHMKRALINSIKL